MKWGPILLISRVSMENMADDCDDGFLLNIRLSLSLLFRFNMGQLKKAILTCIYIYNYRYSYIYIVIYNYIYLFICNMHIHKYCVSHDEHLGCMYHDRVSQFRY